MPRNYQQGPTKAQILESTTKGWYDISTPYVAEFVVNLKVIINPSMRRWNPLTKLWSVHEAALPDLIDLLKVYFDEVVTNIGQKKKPELSSGVDMFDQLFKELRKMPNSNIDKIYAQISMAVHPDKGGSEILMKQLNQAYQTAKK